MKTQLSLAAVVVLVLSSSWIIPNNNGKIVSKPSLTKHTAAAPAFSFFRTHRQGRGITATWGLTSNSGVAGFIVQRTYEDPTDPYSYWENICSMPCGTGKSFKHQDETVSPGFVSYRVVAFLQGSGQLESEILTEHIVSH